MLITEEMSDLILKFVINKKIITFWKEGKSMERKLNYEEVDKALYNIDMNNGFVNFGAMANPKYNKLVPEQLKLIEKMRKEKGIVNFILEGHNEGALEFKTYPKHCVLGTEEADLIPELITYQNNPNAYTFYKNCINGMLNLEVGEQIKQLKNLREIIYGGVCADLCVMDFARTNARFLDQINKDVKLFVVKSTIDTFDAPNHNRKEWLDIAYKVMEQAGIEVVENVEHLNKREKQLKLR